LSKKVWWSAFFFVLSQHALSLDDNDIVRISQRRNMSNVMNSTFLLKHSFGRGHCSFNDWIFFISIICLQTVLVIQFSQVKIIVYTHNKCVCIYKL
jgi:hypothetical protein